ncbi:DUF4862 family protein [Thalassotalea atypica]|uniref:DUF4862 family protein n=1 Tax=Thalassotalea atypica TaxID=2054316 RepID=UPI002573A901|nr:DUF4862 family protein [Thalassotalea atypica]
MSYIVGAYATAPSTFAWDENLESEYYEQLKSMDNIQGIEHPFVGKLHPFDDDWFLANIDSRWQFVFTSIPGVMANLAHNPHFGIASINEDGRQAAIEFYQQARLAIFKLNKHLGKHAVSHMKIHTAPTISAKTSSSKQALHTSLETILSWDWYGAKLLIEHCDAFIPEQSPEKGFLSLEDEIDTVTTINKKLSCNMGVSVNWGRSAIETRSVQGPIKHIKMAYQSKLLRGIIFSGASGEDTPYGQWKDSHMPPAKAFNIPHYAKNSLLTIEQIEKSLQHCDCDNLDFIGGKISLSPNTATVSERVSYIQSLLTLLDKAIK